MFGRKPLIVGLTGALLLLALWPILEPGRSRHILISAVPQTISTEASIPTLDERGSREAALHDSRSPSATPVHLSRVVDETGNGIEGAQILWVALDLKGDGSNNELHLSTTTDDGGRFRFVDAEDVTDGDSVIWVSHEDYLARYSFVAADTTPLLGRAAIVLERAVRRVVRVRERGEEVPMARIVQRGWEGSDDGDSARALRAFSRVYEANEDGLASVVTLPGDERIVASRGVRSSAPYLGRSLGDVTLDLVPTFLARGVVFLSEPNVPAATVSVAGTGKNAMPELGLSRVAEDGRWGPIVVPLTGSESFVFDLAGDGLVPMRREVDAPEPEADIQVDFDASKGLGVRFLVLGEEEEPLKGSTAVVHWRDGERWVKAESAPAGGDGRVLVEGCPSASIYFDVRCRGYGNYRGGPFLVTSPEDSHWTVQLQCASRLVGRCVHRDEPVSTFKVLYWPTGDRDQIRRVEIRDEPAGSFILDDVAPGDLSLVVASEGLAQSGIRQVALTSGEQTELLIELSTAGDGVGRVVDAVTNEPIRGAEVKMFVSGATALDQLGVPVLTSADGGFRISGFGSDPVFFSVSAGGYSRLWSDAKALAGVEADLGVLSLWRKQPLTLRLRCRSTDDPTRFLVECGRTILPQRPFPPDGLLRLDEFDVGAFDFIIEYPDRSHLSIHREFRPGEQWNVEVDVTGGSQLTVQVTPSIGNLPLPLWVAVETPTGDNLFRSLSNDGRAELSRLPAGRCRLEIYDEAGQTLAVKSATLSEASVTNVLIELEEPRRFRVVDAEGGIVAGATIWFGSDDRSGVSFHTVVDAKGEAVVRGLPDDGIVAHVLHPTLGARTNIPIHLGSTFDEAVVLELRARETLPVRFLDGTLPAFGVTCVLNVHANELEIGYPRVTDQDGFVTWGPLAEGDYDVTASHPDYWPVEKTVHANSQPQIVQIRRRGALDLDVDSLSGREEGVSVELFAVDFGCDVAEWVAQKRIDVESGLRTDEEGRLRVPGLPHGMYHWRILTSEGPVEGEAIVPAAGIASERVFVP